MAQKVLVQLVDDLDNNPIENGEGTTVRFGWDGAEYEIDLTNAHADELRTALSDYIAAARKISAPRSDRGRSTAAKATGREDLAAIRKWARNNGHKISDRGRISAEIRNLYNESH